MNRIQARLRSVRARQRAQRTLGGAARGAVAGGGVALAAGLLRVVLAVPLPEAVGMGALVAGPLLGAVVAFLRPCPWARAAHAVDDRFHLKDRSATALEFVTRGRAGELCRLQVSDAEAHLARIDAAQAAPLRAPRGLPLAAGLVAGALLLAFWPTAPAAARTEVRTDLPELAESLVLLEKPLERLVELKEDDDASREELEDLLRELEGGLEELEQPGVGRKDALAKVSEMQAALKAKLAELDVALVAAQLEALGAALQASAVTRPLGKDLQAGRHEQAAEKLEALPGPPEDARELAALEQALQEASETMQAAGLEELSETTAWLAEALRNLDAEGFCRGSGELAGEIRGFCRSREMEEALNACLAACAECKGGMCASVRNGGRKNALSERPSITWGRGVNGTLDGPPTALDAGRELKRVKGVHGEGPSQREIVAGSPEGAAQAGRRSKEVFRRYQKMSEAVLESEPIPLGHRQTIRRYFELIRPDFDDR